MQKSIVADQSVGLQPLQSLGKIDKIFSRSSFQSLSTTRDILEYGPQSPLTESLDSNRSSGVEAFIDQSGASSVLALDGGIHDDRHNLDHQSLQAGLERWGIRHTLPFLLRLQTGTSDRQSAGEVIDVSEKHQSVITSSRPSPASTHSSDCLRLSHNSGAGNGALRWALQYTLS